MPGVLASNRRVQLSDVRMDASHLARLNPEGVDEVNAGLINEESRVIAKERPAVKIRPFSPTIAEPREDVDMSKLADGPIVLNLLDRPVPWLPAKVFMHHEPHAGILRRGHNPRGRFERRRERLLTGM